MTNECPTWFHPEPFRDVPRRIDAWVDGDWRDVRPATLEWPLGDEADAHVLIWRNPTNRLLGLAADG